MFPVDHTIKRIDAVIDEIGRLKECDFPYNSPHDALILLQQKLINQKVILGKITTGTQDKTIQNFSQYFQKWLYEYLPILGFILRSTNIRNGFEAYYPLLRLARMILGNDTKLILSPEWNFSPTVFLSIPDLPSYVLIGLPATESPNPLLLPLAGHELGHSVWHNEMISKNFKTIEQLVLKVLTDKKWDEYTRIYPYYKSLKSKVLLRDDYTIEETWSPAVEWALKQTEEIFCDFFRFTSFWRILSVCFYLSAFTRVCWTTSFTLSQYPSTYLTPFICSQRIQYRSSS